MKPRTNLNTAQSGSNTNVVNLFSARDSWIKKSYCYLFTAPSSHSDALRWRRQRVLPNTAAEQERRFEMRHQESKAQRRPNSYVLTILELPGRSVHPRAARPHDYMYGMGSTAVGILTTGTQKHLHNKSSILIRSLASTTVGSSCLSAYRA